jgi:hypothetical protein
MNGSSAGKKKAPAVPSQSLFLRSIRLLSGVDVSFVDRFFLGFAGIFDGISLIFERIGLNFVRRVVSLLFEHVGLVFGRIGNVVTGCVVTLATACCKRQQTRCYDCLVEIFHRYRPVC